MLLQPYKILIYGNFNKWQAFIKEKEKRENKQTKVEVEQKKNHKIQSLIWICSRLWIYFGSQTKRKKIKYSAVIIILTISMHAQKR